MPCPKQLTVNGSIYILPGSPPHMCKCEIFYLTMQCGHLNVDTFLCQHPQVSSRSCSPNLLCPQSALLHEWWPHPSSFSGQKPWDNLKTPQFLPQLTFKVPKILSQNKSLNWTTPCYSSQGDTMTALIRSCHPLAQYPAKAGCSGSHLSYQHRGGWSVWGKSSTPA